MNHVNQKPARDASKASIATPCFSKNDSAGTISTLKGVVRPRSLRDAAGRRVGLSTGGSLATELDVRSNDWRGSEELATVSPFALSIWVESVSRDRPASALDVGLGVEVVPGVAAGCAERALCSASAGGGSTLRSGETCADDDSATGDSVFGGLASPMETVSKLTVSNTKLHARAAAPERPPSACSVIRRLTKQSLSLQRANHKRIHSLQDSRLRRKAKLTIEMLSGPRIDNAGPEQT